MTIESICFETEWNERNFELGTPEPTTTQKLSNLALNVFSLIVFPVGIIRCANYGIGRLANHITLPAAHYISARRRETSEKIFHDFWEGPITEKNRLIRENYTLVRQTVVTPDKVKLQAICMKHKDSSETTPTLLYFNGNFQLGIETPIDWLLHEAIYADTAFNLVLFDYRGVGNSTGVFSEAKNLILDGISIVDWIEKKIGIIPEQIHFYGFSLGGAVSSLTKALDTKHLTGRMINDRSFSSSREMFYAFFGTGYFGKFMDWCFERHGYGSDPAVAFRKASGEKLVIYHPRDEVIPKNAGMQYAVQHDLHIQLKAKSEFKNEADNYPPHISPLYWHEAAVERVMEFLLPFVSTIKEEVC